MRLISWNVHGRVDDVPEQLKAIASQEPDLVALQEMTRESLHTWKVGLTGLGLPVQEDTSLLLDTPATHGEYDRKYFNLVASRWDLARLAQLLVAYPERYLSVTVAHPTVPLDLSLEPPIRKLIG
jgi:endonuclease/exonuclease/phosphatase family metal-dependent hydrolase